MSALVEIGELRRAHELCEKLLSLASPLGLYGEEIDPNSGRHLGNFPQAFTHLALINAVMHLINAEQEPAAITPFAPRTEDDDAGVEVEDARPNEEARRSVETAEPKGSEREHAGPA